MSFRLCSDEYETVDDLIMLLRTLLTISITKAQNTSWCPKFLEQTDNTDENLKL